MRSLLEAGAAEFCDCCHPRWQMLCAAGTQPYAPLRACLVPCFMACAAGQSASKQLQTSTAVCAQRRAAAGKECHTQTARRMQMYTPDLSQLCCSDTATEAAQAGRCASSCSQAQNVQRTCTPRCHPCTALTTSAYLTRWMSGKSQLRCGTTQQQWTESHACCGRCAAHRCYLQRPSACMLSCAVAALTVTGMQHGVALLSAGATPCNALCVFIRS